ncbi:MAG: bifunctional diaminohydroxyphosphoribosylaminopyrimidine deaminase/5-amino-6-(5-phosphoribosylamino)uracil reductase RibD [Rhodobacteraceae bacterium]|nr:bifunctional diaminohydroxyphosphoribosylaminopyrimidine deaminase/5-amino-6-(5-phosphoribosylamino)uracil reductase RibD [Paracoccaceae bacterium]
MRAAIEIGRRGLGRASPNPAVGCVLVREGVAVGRGWTQPGGRPHAETQALTRAGDAARSATAYVSLEPCAHHGVTPPCSSALIAAGVRRVVTAMEDPDPRVAGRGHALLREAGIEVVTSVMKAEAEATHEGYLIRQRLGRPFVTLKLGQTLDGRIATASGESQWITSAPARARAHLLRVENDAILVGAGTVRADDPSLDVRLPGLSACSPIRVAADSWLSLPLDGKLAQTTPQRPLWILHAPDAPEERRRALEALGAVLIEIPQLEGGGLDLTAGLQALGQRGVTRMMCEGGGQIAASLMRAGLIDRLVTVAAGKAIGEDGRPGIGPLGLERLGDAPHFVLETLEPIGPDALCSWRAVPRPD